MGNICQKFRNIFFSSKEREIIRNNYCILKCKCDKINDIFFCSNCEVYFCKECFKSNHKNKKDHIIEENKKCKKQSEENKFYCFVCQEFFNDGDNIHNNHDNIKFKENEDIPKINSTLIRINDYNKLISSTYDSQKENYFHMKSVINLGKFYKELDEMDLSELEWWSNKFKKARITNKITKKKLNLNKKVKKLTLKLNDDSKLLSKIMFNRNMLTKQ